MKIYNYMLLGVVLIALFNIAGFDVSSSYLIEKVGINDLSNFKSSSLWIALLVVVGTIGAIGAIIGSLSTTSPTYAIKTSFILTVLVLLISDFIWILTKIFSYGVTWVYWIAFMILAPIIVGYSIALIEFWEGRD